ncbi:hypothetical protein RIR_jg32656.t1 [Rhizophagus irregularis DAOM 181602=DAOM 197198]|nr:hypothetical protein RIR_jg32656.t1 [Rhizophagus irregularis DAOM 181602=DAOM 197198]
MTSDLSPEFTKALRYSDYWNIELEEWEVSCQKAVALQDFKAIENRVNKCEMLTVRIRASTNPCFPMKNFGIPITFDESSLRSNSSSPTLHLLIFRYQKISSAKWIVSQVDIFCNLTSPNLHIPHQEENQQELRDYFDDELWQDMKFTLNIRSRTCLQFVRRRFEDRMPTTGLPTAKIMHNILSMPTAIKAYFPETTILRIHTLTIMLASRTSGSSARTKKRFDPSLAGSNTVLTRIDVCRNKTTKSTCRPDKPGSDNSEKNNESIKRLIYWKMLCHGSGIYRMALIGEFTFPKAQQLGETHGCFSGDGHSAGSREQGG